MNKNLLNRPMLAVLLAAGVVSITQGDARPQSVSGRSLEARFVPALRDGRIVGIKVYAVREGSRYDVAGLQNGDTIEEIDGEPVTGLHDSEKVTDARDAITVALRRSGGREIVLITIPRPS